MSTTLTSGANDSVLEGESQHVPIDRYKANLSRLIEMVSSPSSDHYSPETKIICINAPPVMVHKWTEHVAQFKIAAGEADPYKPSRRLEQTKQYSIGCLDVARSYSLPCVDIFSAIIEAAGGADDESLDPYL
jgi:hypothetical protein